jgi:peptidoglycan L-alanyl-D-glutamate endopeptidase CwlK
MIFKFGKASIANMAGLNPKLITVANTAISLSEVDFGVQKKAVRTAFEQNQLYQQGRTKPGKRVTDKDGYKNKSNHQVTSDGTGHSVDFTAWVNGEWDFDDWNHYYKIGHAVAQAAKIHNVKIKWGGNWYECLNDYGNSLKDIIKAVDRYKETHPGPDFIDGPHFELMEG